jgi:hypothetical protein
MSAGDITKGLGVGYNENVTKYNSMYTFNIQ